MHELFIFKPNINNLRMLKIKMKMQNKGKERTKRYKMQPIEMWLEKTPERNKQKRKKMNECKRGGVDSNKGGAESKKKEKEDWGAHGPGFGLETGSG